MGDFFCQVFYLLRQTDSKADQIVISIDRHDNLANTLYARIDIITPCGRFSASAREWVIYYRSAAASSTYELTSRKVKLCPRGGQSYHLYKQRVNPIFGEFVGSNSPRKGKKMGWNDCQFMLRSAQNRGHESALGITLPSEGPPVPSVCQGTPVLMKSTCACH